jgi:hypothetical protein
MTPVVEGAKTVYTLDGAAALIGFDSYAYVI